MTCSHQYVGCGSRGEPGAVFNWESSASGKEMSDSSATGCCTPVNSGDSTPTTVTRTLLILMVLPTVAGSLPNRVCQYFELIIATGGAEGRSSSGRIVRPSRALTPSIW